MQGVGAAILAPATVSLLTTTFTEPAARRRALGAWSATAASGAAVGVLAGGLLTDLLDWRWVLLVNASIGAALIAAAMVSLIESRAEQRPSEDVGGAVTVTGGLALLVYGIVNTDTRSWGSSATILTLLGGAALLAVFVVIERRVANPLVPLNVFRLRSVAAANGIAMTIGAALFGMFFFLSLYLQQINGYSPLTAGLAFLPAALATMGGSLVGTRIVTRLGVRRQLVIGPLMAAAGLVWLAQLSAGDGTRHADDRIGHQIRTWFALHCDRTSASITAPEKPVNSRSRRNRFANAPPRNAGTNPEVAPMKTICAVRSERNVCPACR